MGVSDSSLSCPFGSRKPRTSCRIVFMLVADLHGDRSFEFQWFEFFQVGHGVLNVPLGMSNAQMRPLNLFIY